jgi:hypothetical protein
VTRIRIANVDAVLLRRQAVDLREVDRGEEVKDLRALLELEQHVDRDGRIVALRAEIHTRQTMRSRPVVRPRFSRLRGSDAIGLKRDCLRPLDYALEDHVAFRLGGVGIHAGARSTGKPVEPLLAGQMSPDYIRPVSTINLTADELAR